MEAILTKTKLELVAEAVKLHEPKLGLKRGTPEGEELIRVRCKVRVRHHPGDPDLAKMYEPGEELVVPKWRYTSFHNPPMVMGPKGQMVQAARGSFEPASYQQPIDDGIAKHSDKMQSVLVDNEALRKRIAELEAAQRVPLVVADEPKGKKKSKEEEI